MMNLNRNSTILGTINCKDGVGNVIHSHNLSDAQIAKISENISDAIMAGMLNPKHDVGMAVDRVILNHQFHVR